tara:strand:+ start:209 stop:328 length:120 start_codon:yes stop_codon:yes gene_type:complete
MVKSKKKTTTSKKRATKKTQESAFWTRVVNGMKKILSPK